MTMMSTIATVSQEEHQIADDLGEGRGDHLLDPDGVPSANATDTRTGLRVTAGHMSILAGPISPCLDPEGAAAQGLPVAGQGRRGGRCRTQLAAP
jgi:hypothetical protein